MTEFPHQINRVFNSFRVVTHLRCRVLGNIVFERVSETEWRCRNCGYVHKGKSAPTECPACAHPQSYFELIAKNW